LKGTIWKPIDVSPNFAMLNSFAESLTVVTNVVRIVNNMEDPLTLAAPQSSNPAFRAELKTNQVGKEFQLVISTVPPLNAGNVQVKEEEPGRKFVATLSFPEGFEIPQGQQVEFTVKSTHPQFPLIKVPIVQPPRPATAAVSAPVAVPGATPPAVKPAGQ